MPQYEQVEGKPKTTRVTLAEFTGGWSTRTYPHLMPENYIYVANNVVYYRDGLVSKRPGNIYYGSGNGRTGSGVAINSMTRYYPTTVALPSGILVVQSGSQLYKGNDFNGTFTTLSSSNSTVSSTSNVAWAQMYDPDAPGGGATCLFICDGVNIPKVYNNNNTNSVNTGTYNAIGGAAAGNWLPNDPFNNPITPAYVCSWDYHLVYSGVKTDPSALYISDALRPERFNGYALTDSAATPYTQYYPNGRNGDLGVITGIVPWGQNLLIFYTSGIIVAVNTGQYGAFQYEFYRLSGTKGAKSPRSIVVMDTYVSFFGGDAFYATDGNNVFRLPDELPTVYSNTAKSARPPLIKNPATVFGVRHQDEILWSFDSTGLGPTDQIVMFDTSAQGGYQFGAPKGGAWALWPSGMPMGSAVECRGPGDIFQLFWGSSVGDIVAQHDAGSSTISASAAYADFGAAISIAIQAKSLFYNTSPWTPAHIKTVQSIYVIAAFDVIGPAYEVVVTPQVTFDSTVIGASPITYNIVAGGTTYGNDYYGTFLYESGSPIFQDTLKSYMPANSQGQSVQVGLVESSTNPFNLIGFVIETTIDNPQP
jgi:hypothetical protein